MKIDRNAVLLIAVLVLIPILKGGDSPSPRPDAELAAKCGREYLSRLGEIYETIELPEAEGEFSTLLNERVRAAHNESFLPLDMRLKESEYPSETREVIRNMAKGFGSE